MVLKIHIVGDLTPVCRRFFYPRSEPDYVRPAETFNGPSGKHFDTGDLEFSPSGFGFLGLSSLLDLYHLPTLFVHFLLNLLFSSLDLVNRKSSFFSLFIP